MRFVILISLMLVSGCVTIGPVEPKIPALPAQLEQCFDHVVKLPPGPWGRRATAKLLAELRQSEVNKQRCGKELITLWEEVRHVK